MIEMNTRVDAPQMVFELASSVARFLLCVFVIVCVFDPADQVTGSKVWLFIMLCGMTGIASSLASDKIEIPVNLAVLTLVFVAIPLLSIAWYYLRSGIEPYAGFALLKSYLFLTIAIVLSVNRFDVFPFLSASLSVLAVSTIAISIALSIDPSLSTMLHSLGERTGIFLVYARTYGEGLTVTQVTFATAPMMAMAICYYFDRAASSPGNSSKYSYAALAALNSAAMLLAGLRNTMAAAVLLPLILWPLYTRHITRNALFSLAVLCALSLTQIEKLQAFLNPNEVSNNIKLTFLEDYQSIFSDVNTLFFGQGLGAYYRWSSSGLPDFEKTGANYYFITELTYAEMLRSFGLIGASIMLGIIVYPIARAFFTQSGKYQRTMAIGFLAYLGMSATNPMLFSSSGMLIFSALLVLTSNVFRSTTTRTPS